MVRDPNTGKYRRVRLFVFTLGYSRKSVRLLTWRSSAQMWAELHERAFRRLGGTVKVVVLDNLGEGVLTPDIYDPALNPLYRDVLAHYGVIALPCRVGDPDRNAYASYCTSLRGCDANRRSRSHCLSPFQV
jgi:transposase